MTALILEGLVAALQKYAQHNSLHSALDTQNTKLNSHYSGLSYCLAAWIVRDAATLPWMYCKSKHAVQVITP